MRRPRDMHHYVRANLAADQLTQIAQSLANSEEYPFVKWRLELSYWNPKWKQDGEDRGIITQERLGP